MILSKKIIGIEIGSDTLKAAVCSDGKITDMVSRRLRSGSVLDGRIASPNDMSAFIRETLKDAGIHGTTCALVLPSQFVIGRSITMPAMSDEDLALNLPFEFKDFVGKDSDKYYYDYSIKSSTNNIMNLYACAVLKEDVEMYCNVLKKAGLVLKVIIPQELAWMNLIKRAVNEPKNICIVDIGCNSTFVNIFSNGSFVMGKNISIGGRALDEELAKYLGMDAYAARTRKEANLDNCLSADCCAEIYADIATEVTRTLKYYNDVHHDDMVKDIYYCGGSARIESIRNAIVRSTDMTPHHISRLIPNGENKTDDALCCAIAAGAAIQK